MEKLAIAWCAFMALFVGYEWLRMKKFEKERRKAVKVAEKRYIGHMTSDERWALTGEEKN